MAKGPCAPTSQVAMNAPVHRGSREIRLLVQVVLTSMNALLIPLDIIMWIITMLWLLLSVEVFPSVSILLAVTFASVRQALRVTHESRVSVSLPSLLSLKQYRLFRRPALHPKSLFTLHSHPGSLLILSIQAEREERSSTTSHIEQLSFCNEVSLLRSIPFSSFSRRENPSCFLS